MELHKMIARDRSAGKEVLSDRHPSGVKGADGASLLQNNNGYSVDYERDKTGLYGTGYPGIMTNKPKDDAQKYGCSIYQVGCGVLFIIFGVLGFIFPLRSLLLAEKINMRPGFPAFEWWSNPPEAIRLRIYLFNVTNHERFMMGLDDKINVAEIGPIVYYETLQFSDIAFTENDTLSYKSRRRVRFSAEESKYDTNATIIVPNFALLGVTSMLHSSDKYILRLGFNLLLNVFQNNLFIETTINQYLWEYEEKILKASYKFAPGMIPSENMGILNRTYDILKTDVSVKIGPQWGESDFFNLYKYEGSRDGVLKFAKKGMPLEKLEHLSEGILFPQNLRKEDELLFLSKPMCKLMTLSFDEVKRRGGLDLYQYNFSKSTFDRRPEDVCHGEQCLLPSGLLDSSKCFTDFPVVLSLPHFQGTAVASDKYVTGLKPDQSRHTLGFYRIEPITGIPIELNLKMQCSLWIHNITGLYSSQYDKFSNLVLPLLWLDYTQDGLPPYIMNMLYFTVVIVPILSVSLSCCFLMLGVWILVKQMKDRQLISILKIVGLRSASRCKVDNY